MCVADLALAGQKYEHVAAWILGGDLVDSSDDLLGERKGVRVTFPIGRVVRRCRSAGKVTLTPFRPFPPTQLDRIRAAFDLHDRRVPEMRGKSRGVDRRRGHDELQVTAPGEQAFQIAEQKIDIETALVRLVQDDRVVRIEPWIGLRFGEQDAVRHELDQRLRADLFAEAHLETHQRAELAAEFGGNAPCDVARGDSARLGAANQTGDAATRSQAELRQLRRLARAGFASEHDHLVLVDQFDDLVGARCDRQCFVDTDFGQECRSLRPPRGRCFDRYAQPIEFIGRGRRTRARKPPPARQQTTKIARHHMIERVAQGLGIGHGAIVGDTRIGRERRLENGGNRSSRSNAAIGKFDFTPIAPCVTVGADNYEESAMSIDIGIARKGRESITKNLAKLLADTYSLYLKTHGFHLERDRPDVQQLGLWGRNSTRATNIRRCAAMPVLGMPRSLRRAATAPSWALTRKRWRLARACPGPPSGAWKPATAMFAAWWARLPRSRRRWMFPASS